MLYCCSFLRQCVTLKLFFFPNLQCLSVCPHSYCLLPHRFMAPIASSHLTFTTMHLEGGQSHQAPWCGEALFARSPSLARGGRVCDVLRVCFFLSFFFFPKVFIEVKWANGALLPLRSPSLLSYSRQQHPSAAWSGYSWNRLHVGHTKEAQRRRGTELPWKQTALPSEQMVVVRVSGAGVKWWRDPQMIICPLLKRQLLPNKTGGSGLCCILDASWPQEKKLFRFKRKIFSIWLTAY